MARSSQDLFRALEERRDDVALPLERCLELVRVVAEQKPSLGVTEALARRHEPADLHRLRAGELVYRPGRDRWLREGLRLVGRRALAGLAQLAGELVARRRELGERRP